MTNHNPRESKQETVDLSTVAISSCDPSSLVNIQSARVVNIQSARTVAVLKPLGASADNPMSGTGTTGNQGANNTGANGSTAPPAAPASKVNVEIFYVHPDHLGTPRVITASTALAATTRTGITPAQTVNKAVWRWDSDPFGSNATSTSAPNENPNTLNQVVGSATLPYLFAFDNAFPGQKRDRETGKHYNYFRDYDPQVGRYVESDPIGLDGGINTFLYVKADPLSSSDPTGENPLAGAIGGGFVCGPPCAVVGAAVGFGIGIGIGDYVFSKRGTWRCEAKCNHTAIPPTRQNCCQPPHLTGVGTGPNEEAACRDAKRSATGSASRGCYGRHCRCTTCSKN